MPNRRQAITWNNADSIHWRIYAAQGGYDFNCHCQTDTWHLLPTYRIPILPIQEIKSITSTMYYNAMKVRVCVKWKSAVLSWVLDQLFIHDRKCMETNFTSLAKYIEQITEICINMILFRGIYSMINWRSGPRLNIKTVLSTYGDFHVKDKTAVRTSYL